ncbi:MAG TPA: thioredoxin-like domain-containing protein [Methylomirabilota bacterium]|jgi:thiol-disulfide isomerase/thioredoxin|nr:thioredoxin-like domain-containing protein [Methylomirabilota bacterium]
MRYGVWLGLLLLAVTVAVADEESPPATPPETAPPPLIEVAAAPELDGGIGWLNVARPLTLADLRGKVVLLDFWTYGCINCLHVIPDLKRLEAKYGPALVVIGVHSAKFKNEGEVERMRQAVLRYGREHPIVNDRDFRIWRAYGVRAWPTLVVIDADGDLIGGVEGEGHYEGLDRVIGILIADAKARGALDETPIPLALEKYRLGPSLLAFPGKILADPQADRLFIADTNHNRIVIARRDGQVLHTVGGPDAGRRDGSFAEARFDHPQGLALAGGALYVADRENHLIRKLDLAARRVSTVAGTGSQSHARDARGPALDIGLNSPWDLVAHQSTLYIAMAGPHQLWALDLASGQIRPYAGSGSEDLTDGPLAEAELAQPSGITTDGKRLYFADSEASAIRSADLDPAGEVRTLVGTGLFEFGDVDGHGGAVRLQHPLGVAFHAGKLYVADTYNHKVKVVEPGPGRVATFAGDGAPGHVDGKAARFFEPGGLSVAAGKLYVADTNNHAVRVADLATHQVTTLVLRGLTAPSVAATDLSDVLADTARPTLPAAAVRPGGDGALLLDIRLPAGYKLNPGTPFVYRVREVTGAGLAVPGGEGEKSLERPSLPVRIPLRVGASEGEGRITLSTTFFYCRTDGQGACLIQTAVFEQPIRIAADAPGRELTIRYDVPGPPR